MCCSIMEFKPPFFVMNEDMNKVAPSPGMGRNNFSLHNCRSAINTKASQPTTDFTRGQNNNAIMTEKPVDCLPCLFCSFGEKWKVTPLDKQCSGTGVSEQKD